MHSKASLGNWSTNLWSANLEGASLRGATLEGSKNIHTRSLAYLSLFGGFMLGMISSGLGEVNEYNFLKKARMELALALRIFFSLR